MKPHELDQEPDAAEEAVVAFLAHFIEGDRASLAALCAPDFSWFGRKIAPGRGGGHAAGVLDQGASYVLGAVRRIPSELLDMLDESSSAGPLLPGDAIVLADLAAGPAAVTLAAVVAADGAIRRVYDPAELKQALLDFAATGAGDAE